MKTIKQCVFAGKIMLVALMGLVTACEKEEESDFGELKIEKPGENFWVSDTFQMEVTFDGRKDERFPVIWNVSDESKAEINQKGEVRLKKEGQVKIIATSGDESTDYMIDIQPMHLLYQTTGRASNAIESIDWSDGKTKILLDGTWHFSAPRMAPDLSALVYADTLHQYDTDIFVYTFGQPNRKTIAHHDLWDDQPVWSNDSKRILFRSFRDEGMGCIYLFMFTNSTLINLTPDPVNAAWANRDPAFSPTGRKMAWSCNINGMHDIWIYDFESGEKKAIETTDVFDGEPCWSPDGTKIVFRCIFDYSPRIVDLMIYDLKEKKVQRLEIEGIESDPAWSPNGKFIAFVHEVGNELPSIRYIDIAQPAEVLSLGDHYGFSPSFY